MSNNSLTADSIVSLNDGIAVRYEHNYRGGVIILIDTINDAFWMGNKTSKTLVKLLNHNKNLKISEVFAQVLAEYNENDYETVLNALNQIINTLYMKAFIKIID